MYQQPFQIEKIHLVTLPDEVQRELVKIGQIREMERYSDHFSILGRFIRATGCFMIKIGTHLIEHYSYNELMIPMQREQ